MLDSAFGLDPDDDSPASKQKRIRQDGGAFNGLQFVAKIGVEKGKDGYADKNRLQFVLTRKNQEYAGVMFGTQTGYAPQQAPMQQQAPAQTQPQQQLPQQQGTPNSNVPTWAR